MSAKVFKNLHIMFLCVYTYITYTHVLIRFYEHIATVLKSLYINRKNST